MKNAKFFSGIIGLAVLKGLNPPAINTQAPSISVYVRPAVESGVQTTVTRLNDVDHREFDYESEGAVVYEQKDDWYKIGLNQGKGWVPKNEIIRFMTLDELMKRKMDYLTMDWSGQLWKEPVKRPQDPTFFAHRGTEQPGLFKKADINVLDSQNLRGDVWFKIEILGPGRCNGHEVAAQKPAVLETGWVPAHTSDGKMNLWFLARGC
jgi:hypothetical protein